MGTTAGPHYYLHLGLDPDVAGFGLQSPAQVARSSSRSSAAAAAPQIVRLAPARLNLRLRTSASISSQRDRPHHHPERPAGGHLVAHCPASTASAPPDLGRRPRRSRISKCPAFFGCVGAYLRSSGLLDSGWRPRLYHTRVMHSGLPALPDQPAASVSTRRQEMDARKDMGEEMARLPR